MRCRRPRRTRCARAPSATPCARNCCTETTPCCLAASWASADSPGAGRNPCMARVSSHTPRWGPGGGAKSLRSVAQALRFRQRLELLQRVVLDLADAFAGDVECAADLFEGAGPASGEAEAHLDDLA